MKMQIRNRLRNFLMLSVSLLLLLPAGAAWARGHDHGGSPGKKACPANHPRGGHGKHIEQMKKKLNLDENQVQLLENVQKTRRDFMDRACRGNREGCRNSKLRKRAFHLFRAELAAEHPDFYSAATKLKSEYHGEYRAEFNAMVDARAAFMSSLTPEQRDRLLEMKPRGGKHGPGPGSGHGPKHGRK